MTKPLLSIFADGVRYDSLKYMPFTQKMASVQLRSILGYSITCHPSMYTGLNPENHKVAFHWIRSSKKYGPYKILSYFPDIFPFSNPYVQAIISHFYAKFFLKRIAQPFMGYGKLLNLPMKFWKYVDINERKYWDEDNYIPGEVKTIFELVRENNLKYHVSRLHKPNLGMIDAVEVVNPSEYDWVYYFIGETDSVSHDFTQHSEEGKKTLLKLDQFIENRYLEYVEEFGENGFNFIFWSDHGHIDIKKKINLYDHFKKASRNLKEIFHLIDSTTVRFWPSSRKETEDIKKIMDNVMDAKLVKSEDFKDLHILEDSNLYGDLFYYLEGGVVFTHTIHGFGLKTKSMHGYHPDAEGNLGLFVSNSKINGNEATLPDVFASSLQCLNIPPPKEYELDGKNILSK